MDADEILSRAAASCDGAVQNLLAARIVAVLNQDTAALDGIDSRLADLIE